MALHEQSIGKTDEWYTPPYVFEAMDMEFSIDVASPGREVTPWIPANCFLTKADDGLSQSWAGPVWMNPPFGGRNGILPWLSRFRTHSDGVCLVPDRTSAPWWQEYAPSMDYVLFVTPKIKFVGANGQLGKSPAQGTCLMSTGDRANRALMRASNANLGHIMKAAYTL